MSADTGRQSSSEVAHEAEDTRAHLASTLEQLRDNLRPENMMEEVVSSARIGASTLADGLLDIVKSHPLPAVLIAAGAAMVTGFAAKDAGRSATGGGREEPPASPRMTRHAVRFAPASRTTSEPESVARLSATVDSVRADIRDYAAEHPVPGESATAGDRGRRASLAKLLDEQPLILGAFGLAIGAAIGAALPMTRREESAMGTAAHAVRQSVRSAARQEVEGLRNVAGDAVEGVRRAAAEHGLSTENLTDLARDVGIPARR